VKTASKVYMFLIFLFLYAPIFVLILFSFNNSSAMSRSVFSGFSLRWYRQLFGDSMILEALRNTLIIAVVASAASTVLGTLGAIGINSLKSKWARRMTMNVTNLPMVNPEIVTGVSMMLLFVIATRALGTSLGMGSLIIAHITFCLPYVLLSIRPKLLQMDPHLYEAALDLGCTPAQAFFRVVLPQIVPGIVSGAIMAFTLSIDDFVISYFTSGTTQTLSIYIYSMTRKRISPEINALSTMLFVVILVLLLAVNIGQSGSAARAARRRAAQEEAEVL
jgi:spermidine/putrescine transport system permease protein